MIDYLTFCRLRQLHDEQGLTASQIAAALELDPKTVAKWLTRPTYRPRASGRRPSKLDGFKGQIAALLERHPYTAQQLFQQLQAKGYTGGYSILKEFIRKVRPVRQPAFLSLEFAPGECAQVDWGSFGSVTVGSTRRRLSFFVLVLCYSRLMYLEFTVSEGMEHFLSCHRRAFEFLGGVPEKVMIDNLKVGVLRHPAGEPASFHPRYLDLAAHYGFRPVACNVAKANEKGRVENAVGYVKKNFLAGLELPSFAAVNPAAVVWRDTVANSLPRKNPVCVRCPSIPTTAPWCDRSAPTPVATSCSTPTATRCRTSTLPKSSPSSFTPTNCCSSTTRSSLPPTPAATIAVSSCATPITSAIWWPIGVTPAPKLCC
jgi:transposase